MAFKRKETVIEAIDLNTITPEDAEKRIIAGVKRYATNEPNWSKADANTPYLGHIIGMGIESSNLADITMSIERQFLTQMTKRVPLSEGGAEFRLEKGELGKLRILDGQDALAATPGLSLKMLMDFGHMAQNAAYLEGVISFTHIATIGDGHKLNDALKKTIARVEKLAGNEREDALANLKSLVLQAKAYAAQISDPATLAAARKKVYESDKATCDSLTTELSVANDKLKGLAGAGDPARVAAIQSEIAEIKTRLKLSSQKLRISTEAVGDIGKPSAAASAKTEEIRRVISETIAYAERLG